MPTDFYYLVPYIIQTSYSSIIYLTKLETTHFSSIVVLEITKMLLFKIKSIDRSSLALSMRTFSSPQKKKKSFWDSVIH